MNFKFIDLFAGIGGFRYALESAGGECVFTSEWDADSAFTYETNHGDYPHGDITKIEANSIPDHDVLCAGFPCQAFSISGKQKGFEDSRGTLFYDVARIAKHKKPKVLFLENVRNFARHDNGRTLKVVVSTLEEIGYTVFYKVLKSSDYGVPQARERIYLICFRADLNVQGFNFPSQTSDIKLVRDILEDIPTGSEFAILRPDIEMKNKESTIFDPRSPKQIGRINKGGQGERIYSIDAAGITLSAYGGGAASKTGAFLIKGEVRKLSPRECSRLQGFPEDFIIHPRKNIAYKQFGNSVSIPVLQAVFTEIIKYVDF